jgi:hypothetical protein
VGFRLDRTYVLEFEGALAGAEVAIKATSVGTVLKLRDVADAKEVAELLASHLIGWNLEDRDGNPIPTTAEGILDNVEEAILGRIAAEWYKAATGVTSPLDGPNSMESSLDMEVMELLD